jgi:hypothetical protein
MQEEVCINIFDIIRAEPLFLDNIITRHRMWIFQYDPQTESRENSENIEFFQPTLTTMFMFFFLMKEDYTQNWFLGNKMLMRNVTLKMYNNRGTSRAGEV